jgi:hypothetical protein
MYPRFKQSRKDERDQDHWKTIPSSGFYTRKTFILNAEASLSQQPHLSTAEQLELIKKMQDSQAAGPEEKGIVQKVLSFIPRPIFGASSTSSIPPCNDAEFLTRIPAICDKFPGLAQIAEIALDKAVEYFSNLIKKSTNKLARKLEDIRTEDCRKQLNAQRLIAWKNVVDQSRKTFLGAVKHRFQRDAEW